MNKLLRTFLGLALLFIYGAEAQAGPLTVAVAANVKGAFDELAAEFTKDTKLEVAGVSASSGKIVAQVRSGAPYDVFLSADMEYPDTLYKEGWAVTAPRSYARGVLVLWTVKDFDLHQEMDVLDDFAVKSVAIANPKFAPYGRAALQAMKGARLSKEAEPKLVYSESVMQAAQYVDTGAADVGFVAKSIVVAPEMKDKGKWLEVPRDSYDPIRQGVVVLKHGESIRPEAARKFVDFLFSAKARAILERYGYLLP